MGSEKALTVKKKVVDGLKEKIESAKVVVLSDYRGVTVSQITELRKALHAEESEYKIVKNTLLHRALEAAGYKDFKEHLLGPTAILLGYKEAVGPVKTLVEFIKDSEKGSMKVGIFDKAVIDTKALEEISKLPSREELLAKVVGGMQAPIYGLVNVLQGTIRKLVYALNAVKEQKEKAKA